MCGIKQSVKQVYGKGTSKDCRHHTQKLNELRMTELPIADSVDSETTLDLNNVTVDDANDSSDIGISNSKVHNKWSKYIDEEVGETADDDADDGDVIDGVRYVLNIPQKDRKRKNKSDNNNMKKVCLAPSESNEYPNCNTNDNAEHSLNKNYIQTNSQSLMCNDEPPADVKPHSIIQHEKNMSFEGKNYPSAFKEKPIDKNNKWAKYIEESDDSVAETFEDILMCQAEKNNSDADVHSPKYPSQQTNTYNQETSLNDNEIQKGSGRKLFDVFNNDDDLNLDEIFKI